MKKLSIIVPIYNAERTLKKCIDSIIAQTYSNLEIVLIDDGSFDSSLAICKEYEKKDRRIIVYHKKNEGLVAARKSGIEIANGEYIGFVDSDDFIEEDMYCSLMAEANKNDSDIVIGGIILDYIDHSDIYYNKFSDGYYNKMDIAREILPRMLMKNGFYQFGIIPGVVVKVFKKQLLKESLKKVFNGLTLGEDVAITSFTLFNANSVSIIRKASYHYIQTDVSMIRGYNPNRFNDACKMYKCLCQINENTYIKQLNAYFSCILFNIIADYVQDTDFTKKELKKKIREILNNKISQKVLYAGEMAEWPVRDKLKVMIMKYKMVGILINWLKR